MKILITGATGFVGSHLGDLLDLEGHQVYSLYRNKNKFKEFNIKGTPIEGTFSNLDWVKKLPDDLDAVIHTAGLVHAPNIEDFYKINSEITKDLINKLKFKYKKLIFGLISSQAAQGPNPSNKILDESSNEIPISHYGKSKLKAEYYLKKLAPGEWDYFIIRPPMVIGPRDPAILDMFKMVNSCTVPVCGDKNKKTYSFVSIFDLINGINLAILNAAKINSEIIYISYPKPVTLQNILEQIKLIIKPKFLVYLHIPKFLLTIFAYIIFVINKIIPWINPRLTIDKSREIIPDMWIISSKKSERILGAKYYWNLEKTIEITYQDYKKRGWL